MKKEQEAIAKSTFEFISSVFVQFFFSQYRFFSAGAGWNFTTFFSLPTEKLRYPRPFSCVCVSHEKLPFFICSTPFPCSSSSSVLPSLSNKRKLFPSCHDVVVVCRLVFRKREERESWQNFHTHTYKRIAERYRKFSHFHFQGCEVVN